MKDAKFTIRVSRELLQNAKVYAEKNNTTIDALIDSFLKNIAAHSDLEHAPLVRKISGSLPQNISIQDYRNHLEEKFVN